MLPASPTNRIALWVTLLVLCLGLSRVLVICKGPHCDNRIEIVHGGGSSCCEHEHEHEHEHDGAAGDDLGCVLREGHDECVDVALAIPTGPLPERVSLGFDEAPCFETVVPVAGSRPDVLAQPLRPHSTGPPRVDRRTGLLASTLLLL